MRSRQPPPCLSVNVLDAEAETHIVELEGELDITGAEYVRDLLCEVMGSTVVVDLRRLQFMDATGLSALVQAMKRASETGHRLTIRGAHGIVRRVFSMTELEGMLAD